MTVRIDTVVTRGGDAGQTSLADGSRVDKDSARIKAIGAVDEANAAIGLLRLHCGTDDEADAMLARIQNDLFDVGADLCVPEGPRQRLRFDEAAVLRLEREVDLMNAGLPPLTSFVLPAGSAGSAHAHFARTVVRRAERRVITLSHGDSVTPALCRWLNRLSDHLFVLGRRLNTAGDVLWVPGGSAER